MAMRQQQRGLEKVLNASVRVDGRSEGAGGGSTSWGGDSSVEPCGRIMRSPAGEKGP